MSYLSPSCSPLVGHHHCVAAELATLCSITPLRIKTSISVQASNCPYVLAEDMCRRASTISRSRPYRDPARITSGRMAVRRVPDCAPATAAARNIAATFVRPLAQLVSSDALRYVNGGFMTMCPPDQPRAKSSRPSPTLISGSTSSRPSVSLNLPAAPLSTARSTNLALASLTNTGSRSRPWRTCPQRRRVRGRSCSTGRCRATSISKSPAPTAGSRNGPGESITSWEGLSAAVRRSELLKNAPCSLRIWSGMLLLRVAPAWPSKSSDGSKDGSQFIRELKAASASSSTDDTYESYEVISRLACKVLLTGESIS